MAKQKLDNQKKYIIVDTANTFFRARHVVANGDLDTKIGLALHITLNSIKKAWNDFGGDHVVFCLEGRSWRKDYYPRYKANRKITREKFTPAEEEADKEFWEAFDTFTTFVANKTNCTVLQNERLEADDLIAGWVQSHPDDQHIIISSDSDFAQLISPTVSQYNGITEVTTTIDGYLDKKGDTVIDKKTKEPKAPPDPEWLLFEKCMRGDSSDNVFSAFPKVRKNKLIEAFEDRKNKGFVWNNIMLSKWVDHEGNEHRVKEDYERNRQLIDLTQQPDGVKEHIFETIQKSTQNPKKIAQVGVFLLKLCHRYDLQRVKDNAQLYAEPLNARYGI
jgi:5'-3' exonuclease